MSAPRDPDEVRPLFGGDPYRESQLTRVHGLYPEELQALAVFNAEQSRGLVHGRAWREAMAELQATFDAHQPAPEPAPLPAPVVVPYSEPKHRRRWL